MTNSKERNQQPRKWIGRLPTHCDICDDTLRNKPYFCDARTDIGPWANVCPNCHKALCSSRLGLGLGQKYEIPSGIKLAG